MALENVKVQLEKMPSSIMNTIDNFVEAEGPCISKVKFVFGCSERNNLYGKKYVKFGEFEPMSRNTFG